MRFGSVCSGIEAASVAWEPFGWKAAWLAEIEPFPCAVLAHHYPEVPNLGDMTTIANRVLTDEVEAPDVLTGGTPCQAFSVAGLRESLADDRGNLTLKFVELANAIDYVRARNGAEPSIIIWENVPGVLSTKDNAFGCFLGGLAGESVPIVPPRDKWSNAGCVYGPKRAVAWRTLDAQFFGVAQRRRRVFVVASARDGFDPAEVLFEFEGLRRDIAPSRGEGEEIAGTAAQCFDRQSSGEYGTAPVASTISARDHKSASDLIAYNITFCDANGRRSDRPNGGLYVNETQVSSTLTAAPLPTFISTYSTPAIGNIVQDDVSSTITKNTGSGGETQNPAFVVQLLTFSSQMSQPQVDSDMAPSLGAKNPTAVMHSIAPTLTASNDPSRSPQSTEVTNQVAAVHAASMAVRRLTPIECERLQGFPDNYTNIPWRKQPESPDGLRYKALGNSWAVPVAQWIGARVDAAIKGANHGR